MASSMEDQLFDARVSDLDMWQISKRICRDSYKDLLLEEQVLRQKIRKCVTENNRCNCLSLYMSRLHNIEDQKSIFESGMYDADTEIESAQEDIDIMLGIFQKDFSFK